MRQVQDLIILYNETVWEAATRRDELASELAVQKDAQQLAQILAQQHWRVRLLPVRQDISAMLKRLRAMRPSVIINLCEGFRQRADFESRVAGLLELLHIPFTGNLAPALSLCQDKFQARAVLRAWDLPTPPSWLAQTKDERPRRLKFPLIVKPNAEDASIGINRRAVVHDPQSLRQRIAWVIRRYGAPALIEQYIDGREFGVSIVENKGLQALPVVEAVFRGPSNQPRIIDYAAKWSDQGGRAGVDLICPAPAAAPLIDTLRSLSITAGRALGIRGYARVDFRVNRRGQPFILEVNPNPDISPNDWLDRARQAAGITSADFWKQQIALARQRAGRAAGQS